ncbi:sensory box protein 9 [Salinisphaera hydrothermalis C41B8]|uniref:Sensory box protein 9 n=2 Tax=Salinisphaera TaxID=180541 RepID=A0A084IPD3_SALHC|nr:sensory box protein 9 [Salinisphaera hydrothermalis C41B8]
MMNFALAALSRPRRHPRKALKTKNAETTQAIVVFKPDGTVIDASPHFLTTVGYALGKVVGHHHRIFVPRAVVEQPAYQRLWARLASGEAESGIYQYVCSDGRDLWIQARYKPIRDRRGRVHKIIQHVVDVTDAERRQADLKGQIAAINRSQAVISFELDGTVLDANDNFLNAMGYRRDEIVGRHHRIFVEAEECESPDYRQFWHDLRLGHYKAALFRRRHKNGSPVWIQASYNPIFDNTGEPFKIVKYATDVTAQTLAVTHLQSSLDELSDTVPAIASDAETARESSNDAAIRAREGGTIVEQLVKRIDAINTRARDMAQIVSTLDSLAFQTNILALNASVEAARAGQHGRGFAVVAQDVRQLSTQSADAARDIAALIRGITGSLGECSDGATQTHRAVTGIVEATHQVDTRIRQIAEASQTQAGKIASLDRTLRELATHNH